MKSPMQNPAFWRERAEETRIKANQFHYLDQVEKQRLLRIAEEYDRLADRAVEWKTNSDLVDRRE